MADYTKRFRFIQFAAWVFMLLLFFWVLWSESVKYALFISFSLIVVLAAVFYGHHLTLKKFYETKKFGKYLLSLFLLGILGSSLFFLSFKGDFPIDQKLQAHLIPALLLTFFGVILSGIVYAVEEWFLKTIQKKELEQQNTNAELLYLKTQINPHFLFNTLNNIHGLAIKNSPQISEVIVRLATLMRYMLYESNTDKVPLEREVSYLENYIELQQIRHTADKIVDFKIQGDLTKHKVAPLLFIHLVENAWKHSPKILNSGDIKIHLDVKKTSIDFSIQNPIGKSKLNEVKEQGGIGLSNVKKRLSLLYPNSLHQFKVTKTKDSFHVIMTLSDTGSSLQ